MSEHEVEQVSDVMQGEQAPSPSVADDARKQLMLVTAAQLRKVAPHQRFFGGYRRSDVDYLIERAATTIDELGARVESLQAKLGELRSTQAALEERLQKSVPPTPEEIAGEMFVTAHRAIEQVKEDAQGEADRLVADARGQADQVIREAELRREEFERLRSEAQSTIEAARNEALELRAAVQNERERLIAESMAEAERARAGLDAEKSRLEAAIAELRSTWVSFVGDALARLDGIEPEAGSGSDNGHAATTEQGGPEATPAGPPKADDVVTELHDRLPNGAGNSSPS